MDKNGILFYTLIPSHELSEFIIPDSGTDSSALSLYLVSPVPASPRLMLQLYPLDCSQIQAQKDLGFQAYLDIHTYSFTTPTTTLELIHILRIWKAICTARLLCYSSQFLSPPTNIGYWLLIFSTPFLPLIPVKSWTYDAEWGLYDAEWGLYLGPSSYLVPVSSPSSTSSKNGALC